LHPRLRCAEALAKASFTKARHSFGVASPLIMYYIYSLKCKDGFYIGCTEDLSDRLVRHKKGQIVATKDRLPLDLHFYFVTNDKYKAFNFEKYLKSGSGRAFIKKHF